jgi:hypothetical protein
MALVGGRQSADPDRDVAEIAAAIDDAASLNDPTGQRNMSGMSKGLVSQHATSQVLIDFLSTAIPYAPSAGDRLMRVSSGVTYEVSAVLSDGWGRVVLRCVRLG